MNSEMQELKSIVRVGIVSSVNSGALTARVKYLQQGTMSGDMKLMQNNPDPERKWIPKPGEYVLCLLLPGGDGDGVILGGV